ncbi:MAG: hypothetical protein AAGI17_03065 [Planctomycetota bacterium]
MNLSDPMIRTAVFAVMAVVCLLVVTLAANAVWRAIFSLRRLPRTAGCGACGYEIESLTDGRCPECGAELARVGVPTRGSLVRVQGGVLSALSGWALLLVLAAVLLAWLVEVAAMVPRANWWARRPLPLAAAITLVPPAIGPPSSRLDYVVEAAFDGTVASMTESATSGTFEVEIVVEGETRASIQLDLERTVPADQLPAELSGPGVGILLDSRRSLAYSPRNGERLVGRITEAGGAARERPLPLGAAEIRSVLDGAGITADAAGLLDAEIDLQAEQINSLLNSITFQPVALTNKGGVQTALAAGRRDARATPGITGFEIQIGPRTAALAVIPPDPLVRVIWIAFATVSLLVWSAGASFIVIRRRKLLETAAD